MRERWSGVGGRGGDGVGVCGVGGGRGCTTKIDIGSIVRNCTDDLFISAGRAMAKAFF